MHAVIRREHVLVALQRSIGNAAVASLMAAAGQVQRRSGANAPTSGAGHRTLREGDKGPDVQALQRKLMSWAETSGYEASTWFPGYPETGKFDRVTRILVEDFQRKETHADPNGIAGPEVWEALERAVVRGALLMLEWAEQAFQRGDRQNASAYFLLFLGASPNAFAASLGAYRVAACEHLDGEFEKARASYGEVVKMSGASEKARAAAVQNAERSAAREPFVPDAAVDKEVTQEIITETERLRRMPRPA